MQPVAMSVRHDAIRNEHDAGAIETTVHRRWNPGKWGSLQRPSDQMPEQSARNTPRSVIPAGDDWRHATALRELLRVVACGNTNDGRNMLIARPPEALEHLQPTGKRAVFLIEFVTHSDSGAPGYTGTLAEGRLQTGDTIRVTRSGQTERVAHIVTTDGERPHAEAGQAVTLTLDGELEVARGDILSLAAQPLETTDQFQATLVWLDDEPGLIGRTYELELAGQQTTATMTGIDYRIEFNRQTRASAKTLTLNDISVCKLAISAPVAFDTYEQSRVLGAFMLADRITHVTVAAGLIRHSLRRAINVHRQALSITRTDRERLNGHRGKVVWFTGLSGSGKSTLANALEVHLHALGYRTYILDGDNLRHGLNRDLGFTDADRVENIRRVAEIAKIMLDAGMIVLTAFISPFRREREMARELVGSENFIEIYVKTPLDVCESRDPKGLYKKARSGQLPNLSGIGSPYEAPENADIGIDCSQTPPEMATTEIARRLLADL